VRDSDGPDVVFAHDNNVFRADGEEFELGIVNSAGYYSPLDKFSHEHAIKVTTLDDWFESERNNR